MGSTHLGRGKPWSPVRVTVVCIVGSGNSWDGRHACLRQWPRRPPRILHSPRTLFPTVPCNPEKLRSPQDRYERFARHRIPERTREIYPSQPSSQSRLSSRTMVYLRIEIKSRGGRGGTRKLCNEFYARFYRDFFEIVQRDTPFYRSFWMFRIKKRKKKRKKNLKWKKENEEWMYLSRFALHSPYNRGFLGFYNAFNVALISYFLFSSTLVQ